MAALQYEIQFKNSTNSAYHFGVYQDYPQSPGLQSLVWQERGLGPNSVNKVTWKMQYGVAIAAWDENEKAYSGLQIVNASLGSAYQVTLLEGSIPSIDPTPLETEGLSRLSADQIKLHNNTNKTFDLGFSVDGSLITATRSTGNQWANFIAHPVYYVALYKSVKLGNLVDSDLQVGPVRIEFTDGNQRALVECYTENGRDNLRSSII